MLEISNIGLLTAFAAGAISFLSPCVLPLVPGYLSYVAGRAVSETEGAGGGAVVLRLPAVGLSVCFVLGFSTVFVLLGASATALGQLLLAYRYELNFVGGAIIILFGLFVIGLVRPRSEEHTSELQSLMRISYAVFCLKKKKKNYIR